MTEDIIARLFRSAGLGAVIPPVTPVSGGYMHRMYRVCTRDAVYAVKHLNPLIMKRPGVMENYRRAEELEQVLEDAGIPIVPALAVGGRKMQEAEGGYFYIFRWQEGRITDWNQITADQCRRAGELQGRIHALQSRRTARTEPELSAIDWDRYIAEAARQDSPVAPLLRENRDLLVYARDAVNAARQALPDIESIIDEDMDPKNVMWHDGRPVIIDLECLDRGSPVSSAVQLALQWAGVTTCSLDPAKARAFFDGYLAVYDNGFRDYGNVLGLAYTWIEWLEYNITRALGNCRDESERETGISQVRSTVSRIRHLRAMEDRIRELLDSLSFPESSRC